MQLKNNITYLDDFIPSFDSTGFAFERYLEGI